MRILFVMYDNESARNHVPLGPCYVAAYAREHGFPDVTYYSQDVYHYSEAHLTEYLDRNRFDVAAIGFAAGYYQFDKIKRICQAINKSSQRPFLVLGGHGPSPEPEFFLRTMAADAVVIGEGELVFLNLLRALQSGRSPSELKGIASWKDGVVVVTPREELIAELDSIPFPYFEPLPMEYYLNAKLFGMRPTERMIYMISSRGCNYHCNFCQRLDKGIRFRSVENVVEEIEKYQRDYRISFVHFVDELWMYSKKRALALAEGFLRANLDIHFFCTGRLNVVDKEVLDLMKRAGCQFIDYGIEQFDNTALTAMDKVLTEEQIERGIQLTKQAGIGIAFNIIFGNLGDTPQTLRKSLDFLKKYNDFGQLRVIRPVTPYPGSPLYDHAIETGQLTGPEDFYRKHTNLERLTVNFTRLSDDEVHRLLLDANREIITDYYEHLKGQTIEQFRRVYFENDSSFRGARH